MSNKLEKIANKIKEENYKHLEEYSKEVEIISNIEPAVIKEEDFKKYFLPFIANLLSKEDITENFERFKHNILSLTNSLYLPLKVIDENNNTLFILPPVLLQPDLDDNIIRDELNLSKVFLKFKAMEKTNHRLADELLVNNNTALSKLVVPNKDTKEFFQGEFYKIYKYYNLEQFITEDSEEENIESKQTDDISDIFDYD